MMDSLTKSRLVLKYMDLRSNPLSNRLFLNKREQRREQLRKEKEEIARQKKAEAQAELAGVFYSTLTGTSGAEPTPRPTDDKKINIQISQTVDSFGEPKQLCEMKMFSTGNLNQNTTVVSPDLQAKRRRR